MERPWDQNGPRVDAVPASAWVSHSKTGTSSGTRVHRHGTGSVGRGAELARAGALVADVGVRQAAVREYDCRGSEGVETVGEVMRYDRDCHRNADASASLESGTDASRDGSPATVRRHGR